MLGLGFTGRQRDTGFGWSAADGGSSGRSHTRSVAAESQIPSFEKKDGYTSN